MDSEGLRMLHVFMLDYMRKMNMNQSAESFAREAGINDTSFGFNPPDGFLIDWWTIFWYFYTERRYDRFDESGVVIESSIPAEAQAQEHPQTQVLALAQAQAQAQIQAQAREHAHAHAHQVQVQARPQAQTQTQTYTYNDMGTNNSYVYTMGQTSNQVFPFHGNTESMLRQPILGARGNDEQHGVLSSYMNVDVQGGWALPEHSSNPRHNRHAMDRISRQSLHRVNRRGNQIVRDAASNPTSQRSMRIMNPTTSRPLNGNQIVRDAASNPTSQRSMRIMNPTTSPPLNADSLDLNAILEYFNMQ